MLILDKYYDNKMVKLPRLSSIAVLLYRVAPMRLTNKKSNHLNTRLVQYSTIRCVQLSDGLEHKWWYSELDLEACWSKMSSYKMVNQVTVPSNNYQIPLLFGIWSKYLESYCSCKWINLTAVQRDYRDIQLLCVYPSSQVFRGYFRGETLKHKGEKTYTRIPDSSEYRRSVYCEHSFHPLVKYQTIGQPDTYLPFEHLSSVVFRWFII